jgi:hypothetical protein
MQVSIWLKDGSVYKNAKLLGSNMTIQGQAVDIGSLDRIDDAYLYTLDGAQIYKEQITGGIQIGLAGVSGGLTISIDQIADLERNGAS